MLFFVETFMVYVLTQKSTRLKECWFDQQKLEQDYKK